MIEYFNMKEHAPTPERSRNPQPGLIQYDDGEYAFVLDTPGATIHFDAAMSGELDPVRTSFDTTSYMSGTMVALDCRDHDGNRSIFVAGDAYGSLVCKLDVKDGKASYVLFEDPDFNSALASAPMTIGARHDRLGGRKLAKAYAVPQMALDYTATGVKRAQDGVSSPLSVAARLFQDRINSQSQ